MSVVTQKIERMRDFQSSIFHNQHQRLHKHISQMKSLLISLVLFGLISSTFSQNCGCSSNLCCSQYGYCGVGDSYCGAGCRENCNGGGGSSTGGVTVAQLRAVMQNTLPFTYVNEVSDVLNRYQLNTPLRKAAFFAQVRHETAGCTTFYQPADNGAGAIHMLPANFRIACEDVPEIKAAFQRRFGGGNPCRSGSDVDAGKVIQEPKIAFLTGAWWMAQGSQKILGGPCGDLRPVMDKGLGSQNPLSGYYLVSRCIFGGNPDSGLAQRVNYYRIAKQVFGARKRNNSTIVDEAF